MPLSAVAEPVGLQLRPVGTLLRRVAADGPVFELSSLLSGRMLVIGSAEIARDILHAPVGTWLTGRANRRILPLLPPDTVLTLDGEAHLARRRLLAPMLHGDALAPLAQSVETFAEDEAERWPVGISVALLGRLRFLALRVAARAVFGIEDRAEAVALQRLVQRALPAYGMLGARPALRGLGPLSPEAVARRRREQFAVGLGELLGQRHPRVTELVGGDQLFALLLAAHETTAGALAWLVHELARAPRAAAAVATGRRADRTWLEAVIEETLRLRAPLVDIVRTPAQSVEITGRTVAAGTLMLIPPPLIHRDGVDEPHRFCPERFLSAAPDPQRWVPFGGGERRCLGASLALLTLRHALTTLLSRFTLEPAAARPERARLYGTALVPEQGARTRLSPRRRNY